MVRAFLIVVFAVHLFQLVALIDAYMATDRSKRLRWMPWAMVIDVLVAIWAAVIFWTLP